MSLQYVFVVVFAVLVYSGSCVSSLEQAPHSDYDHHKIYAKNAMGRPRFLAQEKYKQNHISDSKLGKNVKLLEGELKAAKRNEISTDCFGAKGDRGDDTKAFVKAWKKACSSTFEQTTFHVPARKEYNLKPIMFRGPCKSDITLNMDSWNYLGFKESVGL